MKVLITGGAGFIGSHIAEHFQGKAEVRVLDNLRTGFLKNLDGMDVEFIEGSITDRNIVKKAVKDVDYVFHMAAMVSVPESMDNPYECVNMNVNGLLTVLEEASHAGAKKLCFSSSAAIYGDNPVSPKLETMLPAPKSPYGITKLDGEYYCQMFNDEGKIRTSTMRYFNVFGSRQDPKSPYAAAVPIFTEKALRGEPLTIYGDGEQTRDFVHVKDIVAANVFLATTPELSGVYNVAYGKKLTINALADKILQLTNSSSKIQHTSERSGDVKHSLASIDKLLSAGFRSTSNFDDGLQETIDYMKRSLKPVNEQL